MKRFSLFCCLLPLLANLVQGCVHELDKSIHWRLTNSNGSISIHSVTSGRSVHLDLLHAGLIPDPDVGLNEDQVRWVAEEEFWSYTASLRPLLDGSIHSEQKHLLHFEAIDTRATVHLSKRDEEGKRSESERLTFETNNAHRHWTFDVTTHLHGQADTLTIRLHSPIEYAFQESKKEPPFPTQNDIPDAPATQQYEYPHRNFIRKPSSDFGWDWGPAYADSGFQRAQLVRFGECPQRAGVELPSSLTRYAKSPSFFLLDTALDVQRLGEVWRVNASLSLFSARDTAVANTTLNMAIAGTNHSCVTELAATVEPGMNDDGRLWAICDVPSNTVELWWPRGVRLPDGQPTAQRLYNITFNLTTLDNEIESLTWRVRTGFRTIRLDQHKYSAEEVASGITPGSAFNFKINDYPVPLPILGSNIIPFSTFPLSKEGEARTVEYTMDALVASGQNMIRVWGGASYGSDRLYEKADEMGILIWSEFAFACSLYPTYPAFLQNVKVEAEQQVRRISRFASHALWAGNNEGELNMLPVANTYPNGSIYKHQYELLFNDLLRSIVRAHHPSSRYIPSSTTTGGDYPDGLDGVYVPRYRNFTKGEIHGDGEHYGYDANQALDSSTYPLSRFVNEFGMHSMADIRSFDTIATGPRDYNFNSTVARSRNKHSPPGNLTYPWPATDGQAQLTQAITLHFPTPQNYRNNDRSLLSQWSYSTQCFQALYVGNQIGFYRSRVDKGERNMGSLYWQLNSVWKAATDWASLEVQGRWKVLHYVVARMHAENIAYIHHNMSKEVVEVHAITRSWANSSAIAHISWYDWKGQVVEKVQKQVQLGPVSSIKIAEFHLPESGQAPSRYTGKWLHVRLKSTIGSSTLQNEQFFSSTSLAVAPLQPSKLVIVPKAKAISNQVGTRWDIQRYFAGSKNRSPFSASLHALDFEIRNEGKGVAPWVVLTHSDRLRGWFLDEQDGQPGNAFWLLPGETRALRFQCHGKCPVGVEVGRDVSAVSMWNNIEVSS
ncbi:hypothetical protein A4X13_0g3523 [Tilletia indica]|uniref:Beta-mannosidase A n=1 Tax=Tilletia indica TaxID=43049 RepID=A0A177TWZ4_9BASI|nr:hypothetical protein A4X13_0g3523 [Tilletia indica]